jgi:hypothetical protein
LNLKVKIGEAAFILIVFLRRTVRDVNGTIGSAGARPGYNLSLNDPQWSSSISMSAIAVFVNYAAIGLDMVDSARMLSFDDERWNHLQGGYKTPFDPRPCLRKLESQQDTATAWQELWEDLHHQGNVGDASYASVPELVRIHRKGSAADWNIYAMVAIIELARTESRNPEVPEWLRDDYFRSIHELAQIGTKDILSADESETKRAILSVIAIANGLRTHGKFLVAYSEDELSKMKL